MNDSIENNTSLPTIPQDILHEGYVSIDEKLQSWQWVRDYIGLSMHQGGMLNSQNYNTLPDIIIESLKGENISHSDLTGALVIQNYCIFHYYDSHGNTHEIVFQKGHKQKSTDLIGAVGEARKDISPLEGNPEIFTRVFLSLDEIKLKEKEAQTQKVEENAENLRILEAILKSMEEVFQKNEREWTDKVGDEDRIVIHTTEFPWSEIPEVQGKTSLHLTQLQKIAQKLIGELQKKELDTDMQELLGSAEEQYLDYIVGIGDTYEGGARAFHREIQQEEIDILVENLVERKSIPELLNYMLVKHAMIEANNYQSTEVQRTYKHWTHTLNRVVLGKMKDKDVDTKLFHQYAKIVSGRDVPELTKKIGEQRNLSSGNNTEIRSFHSLDNNLFDPESATEALLYVFERPGGVFEKLQKEKGFKIVDPFTEKIEETETIPKNIILSCSTLIGEKVEGIDTSNGGEALLKKAGFGNMFSLEKPYKDLTISEKMQVGITLRLIKKLEEVGKKNPIHFGKRVPSTSSISFEAFGELFLKVGEEGQEAIIVEINQELDGGWFGSKNNLSTLSEGEQELYNLYNDMWGNDGIFDISDGNIETFKAIGQFGAVLIGSIGIAIALGAVAPILVGSSYAFITTSALASVGVSRVVMPEGYDSNEDMLKDVITDSMVAIAFGLLGGKMTQASYARFMQSSGKWLSGEGMKHIGYNAVDIGLLGISTELLRNYFIRTKDIQIHKNLPIIHNEKAIDAKNRFFKEDFHDYVRMNLDPYIQKG